MSTVLSLLLILGIAANIALAHFSDVITMYFNEIDVESEEAVEAREHSEEVAKQIADEGIVLLQNNEDLLPLQETNRLNVFGWSFTDPVYGGTGSGRVNADTATNPRAGLEEAGFEINEQLYNDYVATDLERPIIDMDGQDWTIPEPHPDDFYTEERMQQAKEFSDTAVIFIARSGGEGADLPRSMDGEDTFDPQGGAFSATGNRYGFEDDLDPDKHYLQLSNREQGMVDAVTENFDNVVLVVNSSNTFELSWIEEYEEIKSVLSVPGTGINGFESLGDILAGRVNPSGRTVNAYPRDLLDPPAMENFGDFNYFLEDGEGNLELAYDERGVPLKYIEYVEGIYVGYRFYETAAAEGIINYDEAVQFPFGYGLSYTSFEQSVVPNSVTWDEDIVSFDVEVTNTGSMAGQEVVQTYFEAPYTGNIERSAIDLIAFEKTAMLEPNESETVTITFDVEDMAVFDTNTVYSANGAYVLEGGDYSIYIAQNSNEMIEEVETRNLSTVVYEDGRPSDDQAPINQFDELREGQESIDTYLTRANGFENLDNLVTYEEHLVETEEGEELLRGKVIDQSFVDLINHNRYYIPEDEQSEAPITGADNGLELPDFEGVAYDDESWDELLDQMSVDDLVRLTTLGGYQTAEIESVGKPFTADYDGPSGITAYTSRSDTSGTAFPAGVMLAQTWNVDLANQMGDAIGAEGEAYGVTGWYAPGINIHRSAFSGRNFEYYSEDPHISGKMAANKIYGYEDQGGFVYMKHFALNDQEENRTNGLMTWADEQTVRDIYLRPFELAVKEGGASGVMSGFNSMGTVWAGASGNLLQEVLRNEWGFRGHVNTDFFIGDFYPYMNAVLGFRNGNDLLLTGAAPVGVPDIDTSSNDTLWAMRDASHNILYTVANSRAVDEGMSTDTPTWIRITIAVDILLLIAISVGFFLTFKKTKNKTAEVAD